MVAIDQEVARGPWRLARARLRRDRVAVGCMVFIGLLVLVAVLAKPISALAGFSPTDQDRVNGISPDGLPMPPSMHHWLGTDNLGRDILVRIVYGSQVSLAVGVGAAVAAVIIGVVVGMCAGYLGPPAHSAPGRCGSCSWTSCPTWSRRSSSTPRC